MKTIYLKDKGRYEWSSHYVYKVIQITSTECMTVTVTKDSIQLDYDQDYYEQIHFIKSKLCDGNAVEITRQEFDELYIQTVNAVNDAINLENDIQKLEDEVSRWQKKIDNDLKDFLNT